MNVLPCVALSENCLRCFWSTKNITVSYLVPSLSKPGMLASSPHARLDITEL